MRAMTDADLHAFPVTATTASSTASSTAGPTSAAAPGGEQTEADAGAAHRRALQARRPVRRWPWVLLALAALFVAAVVAGVLLLGTTLDHALGGLDIHVDGERVLAFPQGEAAGWALAAGVLAGLVLLVVVPLSLLLTLLLALLIAALVLAAAVLAVLALGALALSPLWLPALLLWLALRRPRAATGGTPPQTPA
jgi:hypothetical protein